jgi:hypothetical protein
MNKEEILMEMVKIYQKYFKVVETMGTLTMSPKDKERLSFLEAQLK